MGKHLYKIGKRKCYLCKNILDLNFNNFNRNITKSKGFDARCKKCKSNLKVKGNNPQRVRFIKLKKFTCEKCGIQNINSSFFDIDHINPVKNTGTKRKKYLSKIDFSNSMLLCPNCHRLKTIKDQSY